MSGLKPPAAGRGLVRPTPRKAPGLSRPAGKTPGNASNTPQNGSSQTGLDRIKHSASNSSLGGLSRSGSTASVNDHMPPSAGLKVGDRVKTKDTGVAGTVRFKGEPQFAKGIWIGVELDDCSGKNDGEVKGVRYFSCEMNKGLFCKPDKVTKIKSSESGGMRPVRTPSKSNIEEDYENSYGLHVGGRVLVGNEKPGVLRFLGLTKFAKGVWAGIELDAQEGKNDGTCKGHRYFTCENLHGLFAQSSKVTMEPITSPFTSTSSLSSYETPKKDAGDEVMKPDFQNRTPVSTPGVQSSLSGILRSQSRDRNLGPIANFADECNTFAKNIGAKSPTRNGPSQILNTPIKQDIKQDELAHALSSGNLNDTSNEELLKLQTLHAQSEKEREELIEKMRNAENDKVTYENRITEIAQASDTEKKGLQHQIDTLKKELVVLTSNSASTQQKIENQLQAALEHVASLEAQLLQSDCSAELIMTKEKLTELQAEIYSKEEASLLHSTELDAQLATAQAAAKSLEDQLVTAQHNEERLKSAQQRIGELEESLKMSGSSSEAAQKQIADLRGQLSAAEKGLEELINAQQTISDLEGQLTVYRNKGTKALSEYEIKLGDLQSKLLSSNKVVNELEAKISDQSVTNSAEIATHQNKIKELENSLLVVQTEANVNTEASLQQISSLETKLTSLEKLKNAEICELATALKQAEILVTDSEKQISALKLSFDNLLMEKGMESAQSEKQIAELQFQLTELETNNSKKASELGNEIIASKKKISELEKLLVSAQTSSSADFTNAQNTILRLQDELSSETAAKNTEISRLENKLDELETRLAIAQNDKAAESELSAKKVKELQGELAAAKSASSKTLAKSSSKVSELESRLASKEKELSKVTSSSSQRISDLQLQLEESKAGADAQITALQTEVVSQNTELASLKKQLKDKTTLMKSLESGASDKAGAMATLQGELSKKTSELKQVESELSRVASELTDLKTELHTAEHHINEMAEDLDVKGNSITSQTALIAEYKSSIEKFTAELDSLNKQVSYLTEEKRTLQLQLVELEKEKMALVAQLSVKSDEELENLHRQINNLTEENDELRGSFNIKNTAFDELSSEVSTLREISETAFTELKKNEQQFANSVKQLKTTQVQLDNALAKTRELQVKVNDLEEEVVKERSKAKELERRLHTPPSMSFEELDNLSSMSGSPDISPPVFVPNRMFCDNCDIFDDHDTEDCPDNLSRSPGGVMHKGGSGLSGRPYCTVCEMFGHLAADCEDDMTF